jgi:hypothetical protein
MMSHDFAIGLLKDYIESYANQDLSMLEDIVEPSFSKNLKDHFSYSQFHNYDFFIENFRAKQH